MNRSEAYSILAAALERYRKLGFEALCMRAGMAEAEEITAPSGIRYTLEIGVDWSGPALVVRGRIDNQDNFQFAPLEERLCIRNPEEEQ